MKSLKALWNAGGRVCEWLQPLALLLVRIELFIVFFRSGVLKAESWSSTLYLFEYEYHVPFLNYHVAAVLGTGLEIILPFFVLLGLAGRFPVLLLFLFNVFAVISYPALWQPEAFNGLYDHYYWGLMIMVVWFFGTGALSVDAILLRRRKKSS